MGSDTISRWISIHLELSYSVGHLDDVTENSFVGNLTHIW